jgi:maltose O-acetyltransferase
MVRAQSHAKDGSASSQEPNGTAPLLNTDEATEETPGLVRSAGRKLRQLLREEFAGLHLRLIIARTLLALLPFHVGGRVRPLVLRLVGFRIGRGTVMAGTPTIIFEGDMHRTLVIGQGCWINIDCLFDLGAEINVGSNVSMGHGVLLLTRSHDIGPSERRASTLAAKPVTIGSGAWLGSRCVILPGVTIGAGAIVGAGAVVHQDVPPDTVVAGVPARAIRALA